MDCKTLLFMAGALEGGGGQVRAVRAVRAVWAVRAAGVAYPAPGLTEDL